MEENDGRIYLELPIEKEFARLLRLFVAGIAARMDFDLDAVDDLKIAVEEAFLTAMKQRVQSPVQIHFTPTETALRIEFRGEMADGAEHESPSADFGNFILEAVVDELKHGSSGTQFNLSIIKNI